MNNVKIHNVSTGEESEREMTEEELIALQKAKSDSEQLAAKKAEKAFVLAKLGITEEEARLLLG